MKKVSKKRIIEKKINRSLENMDDRERRRIYGNGKPSAPINHVLLTKEEREQLRSGTYVKPEEKKYTKRGFVDTDIVICISSYNRFDKVTRLINQFYSQPTKYSIKIVLLNDGSTDVRYKNIPELYPSILYIENETPNGKVNHWYCYSQMWENLKQIKFHALLQLDDDFILCDNFLDIITDLFFTKRFENYNCLAISPHLWSFKKHTMHEGWWKRTDFVDGIAMIDYTVIENLNYQLQPVDADEVSKPGATVRAWSQISGAIKKMNGIIYRTDYSLVYHDGNLDSKLHGDVRKNGKTGVYTQKFINNL